MFNCCINPLMFDYHFVPPSRRQYCGCFNFGTFGFGMPFMGASLFGCGTPFMNFYNPFVMPAFYNPFGMGYGYNFGFGIETNANGNYSNTRTHTAIISRKNSIEENAKKLGPEFVEKVKEISARLNCDHEDLIAVMASESSLNPKATNLISRATGLIQFTPSTAKGMGTTVKDIKKMSAEEQLVLVEKYLTDRKREAGFSADHKLSAGELYALVFLPARANKEVLCTKGEKSSDGKKLKYYEHNKGLDANKDGQITKTELDARIASKRVSDSIFS